MDINYFINQANEQYKANGRDKKFERIESLVLSKNNPYYSMVFARDVEGADVKSIQSQIINSGNFKYIYEFGKLDVSDYSVAPNTWGDFKCTVENLPEDLRNLVQEVCKDKVMIYYKDGFLVTREGEDRTPHFYIDEETFDNFNGKIANNEPIWPMYLYYAVESNNYDLVKKILDYDNMDVWYSGQKFNYGEEFYVEHGNHILLASPYTTLGYEATGVSDSRILAMLIEKGCSPEFRLGVNPVYNAVQYGTLENVKYMVDELGIKINEDDNVSCNDGIYGTYSDVQLAYILGKKDVFEYFLSKGVKVDNNVFEWYSVLKGAGLNPDDFAERGTIREYIEATNDKEYLELINSESYQTALKEREERDKLAEEKAMKDLEGLLDCGVCQEIWVDYDEYDEDDEDLPLPY